MMSRMNKTKNKPQLQQTDCGALQQPLHFPDRRCDKLLCTFGSWLYSKAVFERFWTTGELARAQPISGMQNQGMTDEMKPSVASTIGMFGRPSASSVGVMVRAARNVAMVAQSDCMRRSGP